MVVAGILLVPSMAVAAAVEALVVERLVLLA
jgi:hypothetical protein